MKVLVFDEFESEAFPENILRIGVLQDGTSVLSTYNMSKQQTAISYISLQQTMRGAHA